uniref:Variant surface glycoprotein 1125.2532 n=1 Tax=Trypanosoma brucei TaxID=5691 RepID=A0A1J0R7Y8_9TRYP|nr:variant surface glycoprotein 1125.2532 [Trypanosoma brucei]
MYIYFKGKGKDGRYLLTHQMNMRLTTKTHTKFIFLVAALAATWNAAESTAGDGANAADFQVLCALVNLAQTDLSTAFPKKPIAESALDTIRDIYISIADPDWLKMFPDKPPQETPTAKAVGCGKPEEETDCLANWTKWTAAKARAKEEGKNAKFPRLSDEVTKSSWGKRQAEYVAHLESEATRLHKRYKASEEATANPKSSGLQKQLDNALYGKDATSKDGQATQTRTTGGDRNSECKGTNVGKSLIGDLFCLCAVDSTTNNALSCGFDTAGCTGTAWSSCTAASAGETWTKIKEQCGHYLKPQLTHSAISMTLSAFLGRLQRDATKDIRNQIAVFLGQHNNGDCGDNNAKRCLDYTNAFKGGPAAHKIAWFDAILAADSELVTLETAEAAVEKTCRAIAQATRQATLIYRSLSVPGATKLLNPQGAPITIVQLTAEKENKCKIKNHRRMPRSSLRLRRKDTRMQT